MRLLFAAPFPYGPHSSHGGAVAAYAQFAALRPAHEISVVAFEPAGAEAAACDFLAAHTERFVTVPLQSGRLRSKLARLRGWRSGWPVDAEIYRSERMAQALREAAVALQPDAVIIQFPPMAQYVDAVSGYPVFMDVQDAFSVSAYRMAAAQSGLRRWERLWDWLSWVRYERHFYPRFDAVFTLTQQDLYGLRTFVPGLRGESLGVPVWLPEHPRGWSADAPPVIRFVGGFKHPANRTAVSYFLREVWPRIHAQVPQARVEIAGKNPPMDLLEFADEKVQFLGFIPNLAQFLASATAVVIPLLSGGGIKIKTLEALAAGAAVVSTSIGVEGIDGIDGKHFLVRDDAAGFADAVLRLLAAPASFSGMRACGRALVEAQYSPAAWSERFAALLGATAPRSLRTEVAL